MKNKTFDLLKTLLLSTSQFNAYKHARDKKRRGKIMAGIIGNTVLYLLIMAYSILMCVGYGKTGLIDSVPVMCAMLISILAFIFTFLKTNGYLFNFKEYDMLMSLPFETRTVASAKFMYMYVKSLGWYLSISTAMLIGYAVFAKPPVIVYPLWLLLSFFIPLVPMVAATFIGFLIAKVSAGFRKTNVAQTIFAFIIILLCFSLRFFTEDTLKNDKIDETMRTISDTTDKAAAVYPPIEWFKNAVTEISISDTLLIIGPSILIFSIVFIIVGRSYRKINSAMRSHATAKNFAMTVQKQHNPVWSIAFKEYKRMTGSTVYMTNAFFGELLVTLLSIVTLVIGFDRMVSMVVQGAPVNPAILQPAIPFVIFFFVGMVSTTVFSPSLEGKNYWIVQSLPLSKKTLYQGKMLFNLILTVPFTLFATICMCVSSHTPVINTIMYLLLGIVLCAYSTSWGCVCGVKHIKLEWENEVEVIKQGVATVIYLLPNMFVSMGLMVLVVVLGLHMSHVLLAAILTLIYGVIAVLSYMRVMSLAKRR